MTLTGGAGTMIVELAAVRLLAPWFGTSLIVWTNVIAVVLLALALGYLAGGRLSLSGRPLRRLSGALALGGLLVAWLPQIGAVAAELLLPAELTLNDAAQVAAWGSLAVALLVLLPPAGLLGAVAPLAVQAFQELEERTAGHAGGAVLCSSTIGSLTGVFGTSHVLLPLLGLRWTFLVASGALLGAAGLAWALGGPRTARASLAALLVAIGTASAAALPERRPAPRPGLRELERAESRYQSVRVVEDRRSEEPLRYLQVNEGLDSYQSVWSPRPGLLPQGFYYNDALLPALWEGAPASWSVLVLGFGAGTVARVLAGALPPATELALVGIELDPLVVELGRRHMELDDAPPGLVVVEGLDARLALRALEPESFDQVFLDAYANQVEIPAHLATVEFFREVRAHLRRGGWLSANIGGYAFDDPVVAALARTCAVAFQAPVLLLRVPHARNFTLLARRDAALPLEEGALAAAAPPGQELLAPRREARGWRVVEPDAGGRLLRDDRAPLATLQLRALLQARSLLRGTEPASVLDEAYGVAQARERTEQLFQAGDPAGAVRLAEQALARFPGDLPLRHRALASSLRIGDVTAARTHLEALAGSLASAPLAPDEAEAWRRELAELAAATEALSRGQAQRDRALRWSRGIVFTGLAATLLALLAGTRVPSG